MTSLAEIRNPWKRRSALIFGIAFVLPLLLIAVAIEGAAGEVRQEWRESVWFIRRAWRG